MKQTFIQFLTEGPIRKTDPAMDDYYGDVEDIDSNAGDAPYAVGWSGQYLEWYGSDAGPASGEGRYKPKGDGGDIVAINVPSYEMAQKLASQLEDKLSQEDLGEYGKDWGVVQGSDVYIISMNDMDDYLRRDLEYEMKYHPGKIKDYSKMTESAKPSAGMSKKKKSAVAKKARAGKDIGKKGKNFEKVAAKAARRYGSKEAGEKVAAAAMWKAQGKK